MFGLFFSGGGSVLPFLALLRFLDAEKLLDLLYKDFHQLWEVLQCLQKRLAFFFEPGIAGTSFSLPNCRFVPETQKLPKPFPAV